MSDVTMNQTRKNLLININGAGYYRDYTKVNATGNPPRASSWQYLYASDFYYYELQHIQGTGPDHLSMAVEI